MFHNLINFANIKGLGAASAHEKADISSGDDSMNSDDDLGAGTDK